MRVNASALIFAAIVLPSGASAQETTATPDDTANGWVRIVPEPVTINGKLYSPTCSNAPGTDPTFSYYFRKGTGDGLAVFFNGGGACWNDATCSKPRLAGDKAMFSGKDDEDAQSVYKAELLPGDGPGHMKGILDPADPRNPVRDWSMLFVPYCTGDVHSGSNTAHYRFPDTGKPFTIEHRGWDNMQVIMHWMQANVPPPGRLLVSGSSAGAYGAATHFTALHQLYPNASAVYLGDSGQGVTPPEFEKARDASWNYQLPVSVFGPDAGATPDTEVVGRLAAFFPKDRFAQFTTIHDRTQTAFYAQMTQTYDCDAWTKKMTSQLTSRQSAPNFRSYVAQGDTHTILRSPLFYTEASGGTAFVDWLSALLNGEMPANETCADCLMAQSNCSQ